MRVELAPEYRGSAEAEDAADIVESCVHCGLCTAVCPTYELHDHELDSPRGRIYLIREMLQGAGVGERTQTHLDRCLTCRACESACPSGVQYGHLIDFARQEIGRRVPASRLDRFRRQILRLALKRKGLLLAAMRVAWTIRPVLPQSLRRRIPHRQAVRHRPGKFPSHARRVLSLGGCVQPVLSPGHASALATLLAHAGVEVVGVEATGCCGAIDQHLGATGTAAAAIRRNIDAWWPLIEDGADAIVITSSGCGAMVADYGHLLRNDPDYADKARAVSAMVRDPADLIGELWVANPPALTPVAEQDAHIAYQAPCTQQNGLKVKGAVERLLTRAGYRLAAVKEGHLCCGSAGTYSILHPETAGRLRERKLGRLTADSPGRIVSANIGCILHLQQESPVPVTHWLELLADRLPPRSHAEMPS